MISVLRNISLLVCALAFGLNLWLAGLYNGFAYGASEICQKIYPSFESQGVSWSISDSDPYVYIVNWQATLSIFLLLFLVLKIFEKSLFILFLEFVPLVVATFCWLQISHLRTSELSSADNYIDPIRRTGSVVWALLALLVALLLVNVFAISIGKSRVKSAK